MADAQVGIDERVRAVVTDVLNNFTFEEIKPESRFDEDLSADSLDMIEVVMGVENEFAFDTLPDEIVLSWKTVGDVITFVKTKTGAP